MTIAFLDQSGELGGAELMLSELLPHLKVSAHVVLLEGGKFEKFLRDKGVRVTIVDLKEAMQSAVTKQAGVLKLLSVLPGVISCVAKVKNAIKGADLLYANTPKAWVIGGLAAFIAGIPMVCHLHDILSKEHFSRANRRMMVLCANKLARAVIVNSQAVANAFVAAGGNSQKVKVIPNGFELDVFSQICFAGASIRRELNLSAEPLVVMAGRLAPWKGQHIFIEAMARIPAIHGLILGDAFFTEEDRRYAAELPELARELRCADRVHFLGFRPDVIAVFRDSDIVAHCSVLAEPFGRVVVEGMLCGKPVVAANEGGPAEIIEHAVTGLLYAPGDVEALVKCLERLLSDPSEAKKIAVRGQEVARVKYDLHNVAATTQTVLDAAVACT